MNKCVHQEKSRCGRCCQFFPFYDSEEGLLFVFGKGSCSAKLFEIDVSRAPNMYHLLQIVV